jgi:hypothetical protein
VRALVMSLFLAATVGPASAAAQGVPQEASAARLLEVVEIAMPICRRAAQQGRAYTSRQRAEWVAVQLQAQRLTGQELLIGLNLCQAYMRGANDQRDGVLPASR